MVEITFDGRKVAVEPNTNLVEAGKAAGVPVPVFCYQKDLGAVGSCRVCAVTVTGKDGKPRTVMACMTAAQDGMAVTTLDPASVALRKYVVEWLMVNHPHDCPICDEGGECQLQDLTIACGHSQRRVNVAKRTFENQFLGEFIAHEMNRCITCYRCSRFYQEYAGGHDFGAFGSRDRVTFGRFEDGPLESPFSGNIVELCPTGVFTDKIFRYRSRVWDLEIGHSVCPHCSVGCNVHPGSRFRELQRVRVRENPAVNGVFLCDRGQFGHGYVMDPARPVTLKLQGGDTTWENAQGLAGAELLAIAQQKGAASIALIASERASVETHAALEALAQGPLAGARIAHFDDPDREARALAALAAIQSAQVEPLDQGDIAGCDVLLVAGSSLVDEAPLAALAARQVARRGGKVIVINAGEHYLADVADVMPVHPAKLAGELNAIAVAIAAGGADDARGRLAKTLGAAKHPGILLGSELVDGPAFRAGAAVAQALNAKGAATRFGCVFPGPNGFGAAAFAAAAAGTGGLAPILADLAAGKLGAVVLAECVTDAWTPRQVEALRSVELTVVLDHLAGPLADTARIFMPTETTYEAYGSYVNRAGRLQAFAPSRHVGKPVLDDLNGSSFPRAYHVAPPLGDARPAWAALEAIREAALGTPAARSLGELRAAVARAGAAWAPLREIHPGSEGAPLDPAALPRAESALGAFPAAGGGLAVFRVERTLGSEVLSRRSEPMRKMARAPKAVMAATELAKLGGGEGVALTVNGRTVELAAIGHPTAPEGVVLVPRDVELAPGTPQGAPGKLVAHVMA